MSRKANRGSQALSAQLELPLSPVAAPLEPEFSPLDVRFAELMMRLNGEPNEMLSRAARLVSAARGAGESCLPLGRLGGDVAAARKYLRAAKVVGEPGAWQPLILDGADRLYLQRYWEYEQRLAEALAQRLQASAPADTSSAIEAMLARWLSSEQAGDQRQAARVALASGFCVITGGPGTGKTRTVAVILMLLEAQAVESGAPVPRTLLAAPTGKAATRLKESIRQVLAELAPEAPPRPVEAVTLHRLLGLHGDSPSPRFDARHPLSADVVIVDEASMVDLAMMAKLFAAVPPAARLILLGDRDQLPPVETGHVLGDLCADAPPLLAERLVALRQNFRFGAESGIKLLSDAVQAGDPEPVLAMLASGGLPDLLASEVASPEGLRSQLEAPVLAGYGPICEARHDPEAALAALGGFRILCALREGPYGVENLNRLVEAALAAHGRIVPGMRHYSGRPIMILRNDYQLGLFNGDIGLVLPDAEGELRAFFRAEDGALRQLALARLPEHETAWAMTVHKSQGSEFQRLLLILPDRESPVVSRELVYTAITRARAAAKIWYRAEPLRRALLHRTERASGLGEALRARLGGS